MIGMTFLVVVRQCSRASSNALITSEDEVAPQSGMRHAVVTLRDMVATYSIVTRDGVFSPGGAGFKYTNVDDWNWENNPTTYPPPPAPNAYWHFESLDVNMPALSALSDSPTHLRYTLAFDNSGYVNPPTPAYLTPLRCGAMTVSIIPPGGAGLPMAEEHAHQHQLKMVGNTVNDFYPGLPAIKELPRVSSIRGDYYVWIADLDARLYAVPKAWPIDTLNLDDCNQGMGDAWAANVRKNILAFEYPVGNPTVRLLEKPANGAPDVAADLFKLVPNTSAGRDLRCPDFPTSRDMGLTLPSVVQAWDDADRAYQDYLNADSAGRPAAWDAYVLVRDKYLLAKSDLDAYFTVYRDAGNTGGTPFDTVKDGPVAVNINTAPVEVIAAMLSQIPVQDDQFSLCTDAGGTGERAWRLAQRIVAKRPFLCRMDFEDFLAAHIRGKVSQLPFMAGDLPEYSVPADLTLGTDTDEYYFVAMIYYAIDKRWGVDHQLTDPLFKKPELSLFKYLDIELPDPPIPPAQFKAKINDRDTWPNEPAFQKVRFEYFFADRYIRLGPGSATVPVGDDRKVVSVDKNNNVSGGMILPGPNNLLETVPGAGDTVVTAPALRDGLTTLTPKEFNNIVNSLTGTTFTDDVQMLPMGATGSYDDIAIEPGPNGKLETPPQGGNVVLSYLKLGPTSTTMPLPPDDELDTDAKWGRVIKPGPNLTLETPADPAQGDTVIAAGIALGSSNRVETSIPRGRPSYYSFVDDAMYAESFWSTHPASATPIANTAPEFDAAKHMRFYYRLKLKTIPGTPPTYDWEDAVLCDPTDPLVGLMSWSCYPDVGSDRKPGFYQMNFADWTLSSFSVTCYYGYGPMLAQGDPDYEMTRDDSTAKRTSGSQGNGDVSWSPQVAFRSRYFGIYVLGRGLIRGWSAAANGPLKVTGERRMEAVYDALKDEIIWQRAPASDKRSLADP
ncbi:MAG: hypothetical protein NTW87_09110 [Planctomycetota bacterium]|nr:hypothetical protein [Planctomycetota bacterium]